MMTEDFPRLYQAIYDRDSNALLSFTKHEWEAVRRQAWRALISTPVDNLDEFIERVIQANTDEAWVALSLKELNDEQLNDLAESWERNLSLRAGVSQVLGQQGNEESLHFLTQNFEEIIFSSFEFEAALAIGRLLGRHQISTFNEEVILRHAAIQEDPNLVRAYFYGHYRNGKIIEASRFQKIIWDSYLHAENPIIQQYMLKIAFQSDTENSFKKLDISEVQHMNVQLAVELTAFLSDITWSEKLEEIFGKLLEHTNPVVNEAALDQVRTHPEKSREFDEVIISHIVENDEKEAAVRLSGIKALHTPDDFQELADSLSAHNEYLLIKKLDIYKEILTGDEFLNQIESYTKSENRKEILFAVQALSGWWIGIPEGQKSAARIEKVRDILFEILEKGDRSITYSVGELLMSPELIHENDFDRFAEYLTRFQLPDDVEVYQSIAGFFKERFEGQAKPLIDSLAAKGNFALNRTLDNQGWEFQETEGQPENFREPDWYRLLELGFNPTWVLETEKGIIKVKMDVLSAPATISGMDSLIVAGAYDGVAFHRVVSNFVVQGGDVETGDGFGGPDYVVPTEASEKQYWRGMVGIASAGTDTEGSQYFFMHQWVPHLNGRYTIVGEVVEGMDIVDKMMVGDKVERTYWVTD
ncbi:MAG: peptidylprolyl isomerase [Balneolaceae bacterium]